MSGPQRSQSRLSSFRSAFGGWWYAIRTQRNAWIHSLATLLVFIFGIWLRIDRLEWILVFLAVGMVWLAECFNTALEAVVDLTSPELHPLAQAGKDVGAAAVLIAAITSTLVGMFIFGPALLDKLSGL